MKRKYLNKYSIAGVLFLTAAAALIAIALNIYFTEFIVAAFVISAMAMGMTGIFMLTFSGGEPVDPRLVGLLPAQGCINLCRIATDLDIQGRAYFLPRSVTGETRVMQFNPASTYNGGEVPAQTSFPKKEAAGLVTIPSGNPLIQELRKRNALVIPENEEQLAQLIRETAREIFEFAPRVSASWNKDRITIIFHHYRFIAGCQYMAQESPGCCTRNPCPACSLCGVLIAEGRNKVVSLEECSVSASKQDVIIIYSIMPPT
jgi:hypothetical protein